MLARRVLLPVLAVALVVAGCGGGSDSKSSTEKLMIAQANSDVQEFCSVAATKKGDVYDRAYFAMLDAVDTLIDAYKTEKSLKVNVDPAKPGVEVQKIVTDSATALKGCGPDGRQQAGRLQQTIQQ